MIKRTREDIFVGLAVLAYIALVVCVVFAGKVHAQTTNTTGPLPTFSWSAPTMRTDGSALPASDIAHYTLTCDSLKVAQPGGTLTTFKLTSPLAAGAHSCTIDVTDTAGSTSAESNPVNFTVVLPAPDAPGGLSVT